MIDTLQYEDRKAAYFTLGCKLNFAETSTIGKALLERGIRKVREGEKADVCIVNTCSVTELADKKCRSAIRRIRKDHPNALLIVTGCYAQLKPEEVASIEGVDLVLGADQKLDLLHYLDLVDCGRTQIFTSKSRDIRVFNPSCSSDDRTRHFLKVQDGCDYYCTYCTIPAERGPSRNGSIGLLVDQARDVVAEGGREIVLTGVNIGDFGRTTGERLIDLLQALDRVEGIERYRISSIEPNLLSNEIIDFVAESKRFAPHFHMPLQSGSDAVLRLMRRRYDTKLFTDRVAHIKGLMPRAFIGIDVIVGSRGEEPQLFEETYAYLQQLPFSALHVFSYSERAGTSALKIDYKVDPRDKHKRSELLLSLSERKLSDFTRSGVGYTYQVLWEQGKGVWMEGYTENYLRCAAPYRQEAIGQVEPFTACAYHEATGLLLGKEGLALPNQIESARG